jgi:hypothetical protein
LVFFIFHPDRWLSTRPEIGGQFGSLRIVPTKYSKMSFQVKDIPDNVPVWQDSLRAGIDHPGEYGIQEILSASLSHAPSYFLAAQAPMSHKRGTGTGVYPFQRY